ncbi:MAG: hypothetical protein IT357_18685, partial [Gemmatimonadaceae bacterium]|nr:hypothetical protein [Gemmatimonadaceae bacterium]
KRLAFDAAKGRLWVVCPSCRQWNLSPLDERWEAIEAAEQLYHDTRKRVATDQIGLAVLADKTELIRIGKPVLPEFAAWRYGPRFRARHRKAVLIGSGAIVAGIAGFIAGPITGLVSGGVAMLPVHIFNMSHLFTRASRSIARFETPSGIRSASSVHVGTTHLFRVPDDPQGWAISLRLFRGDVPVGRFGASYSKEDARVTLTGEQARAALGLLLPRMNREGGGKRTVESTVKLIESAGSPEAVIQRVAEASERRQKVDSTQGLAWIDPEFRLALEMVTQEAAERRAMEGELGALEAAWKDAEEIAAIADSLTLPQQLLTRLERLGGKA